MIVRCELCGGNNEALPGQKMLKCTYCGSALALEDNDFEHLILPHERNDSAAENMLRSFLLRRGAPGPDKLRIDFSYVPFSVIEDSSGGSGCIPAEGAPGAVGPLGDIPAGDYSFFDEKYASGEKIVPEKERDPKASKLIHIPLYIMTFKLKGKLSRAVVTGENWHVQMEKVPVRRKDNLDTGMLLPAAGLFVLYLIIGKLGGGFAARAGFITAAAAAGWFGFRAWERLASRNAG